MYGGWQNYRLLWFLGPLAILDLVLRGFALWRAARNGHKWWFVALLLINSLGIIPAIYLLTNKEKKASKKS